jgi:hypothetical protein
MTGLACWMLVIGGLGALALVLAGSAAIALALQFASAVERDIKRLCEYIDILDDRLKELEGDRSEEDWWRDQ